MKKKSLFLSLILLAACSENLDMQGMFMPITTGSDERFEQSMAWNAQHGVDTIQVSEDNYKVYVMTDVHVDFTTMNLDAFASTYLADTEAAPFCLLLGDLINAKGHYELFMDHIRPILDSDRDTIFSTVGNHDLYYDQWPIYRDYWHTSTYYFVVKTPHYQDLYISFDSGNGTFGKKQLAWLRDLAKTLDRSAYRHVITYTHTHFFKQDGSQGHTSNFAMEETYEIAGYLQQMQADIMLQGHSHFRNLNVFKDVTYLRLDAMEDHYKNAFYTTLEVGPRIDWTFHPVGPQDADQHHAGDEIPEAYIRP